MAPALPHLIHVSETALQLGGQNFAFVDLYATVDRCPRTKTFEKCTRIWSHSYMTI